MSASVFRIATREAIREIITENAQQGRFGLLLSEADLESASDKIVDLMETALTLRTGVQDRLERASQAAAAAESQRTPTLSHRTRGAQSSPDEFGGKAISFPRTRNAADIYEKTTPRPRESVIDTAPVPPPFDVRLTRRQRVTLSESEREKLGGSR